MNFMNFVTPAAGGTSFQQKVLLNTAFNLETIFQSFPALFKRENINFLLRNNKPVPLLYTHNNSTSYSSTINNDVNTYHFKRCNIMLIQESNRYNCKIF